MLSLWAAGMGEGREVKPITTPPRQDSKMIPPTYGGERELLYAACTFAEKFDEHVTPAHLPLYKRLIEDGGWWDLVDWVAGRMISPMVRTHRTATVPVMKKWVEDENLWVRRAAILCQLNHNADTDTALLYDLCLRPGALRRISSSGRPWDGLSGIMRGPIPMAFARSSKSTDPKLSPLTIREAGKNIGVRP